MLKLFGTLCCDPLNYFSHAHTCKDCTNPKALGEQYLDNRMTTIKIPIVRPNSWGDTGAIFHRYGYGTRYYTGNGTRIRLFLKY